MKTTEQRFLEKVAPANEAGCHLWKASKSIYGYGLFCVDGRMSAAHRVAWKIANGPITGGLHVLHKCDVRACCNPEHLFLGTHAENMADMNRKGRQVPPIGSKNGQSKLTEREAVEIFCSEGTQKSIGARFGVTQELVGYIKRRVLWTHATNAITQPKQES